MKGFRQHLIDIIPQARQILAAYLMLGFFMGFLFFHGIFYYYTFNDRIPSWFLLLALALVGTVTGYLFPDLKIAILSSVVLPLAGALFCLLLFISPTASRYIVTSNISDGFFILARVLLPYLFLAFLVIFGMSFIMVAISEEYYQDETEE